MIRRLSVAALLALAASNGARAELPSVSAADRALNSVSWDSGAVAVVLERDATVRLRDFSKQEVNSTLILDQREKILRPEGLERANVRLLHSAYTRLVRFSGNVLLPDGSRVELPADTSFKTTLSAAQRRFVSSFAFPGVVVGAILEYHAEFAWDSVFFVDPWFFHDSIPVQRSTITFEIPNSLEAAVWKRDPFQVGIRTEQLQAGRGYHLMRATAERLPGLTTETYGWPIADLASQIMMVPTAFRSADVYERLLSDWPSTCKIYDGLYYRALHEDAGIEARARQLTSGVSQKIDKVRALFRFVRDQIATDPVPGVAVVENRGIDDVLTAGRGDFADKTLLLAGLLESIKIPARILWVADRSGGQVDLQVPSPGWFDRPIAAVDLDGKRLYLDTSDRAIAFGALAAGLEGMPALVWSVKKPEIVTLPESPAADNARRARIVLHVDTDGSLAGEGHLLLAGHAAAEARQSIGGTEAPESWSRWLGERSPGFRVADVRVGDRGDDGLEAQWSLTSLDEAAGNRLRFSPTVPLGPRTQPFPIAVRRLSPALFPFNETEEVTLALDWPAEWQLHAAPDAVRFDGAAGSVLLEVTSGQNRVDVKHVFVRTRRLASSREEFEAVRELYRRVAETDARAVTLARR